MHVPVNSRFSTVSNDTIKMSFFENAIRDNDTSVNIRELSDEELGIERNESPSEKSEDF